MNRYPPRYHNDSHHGYQPSLYSFGNGYREEDRDDRRRPVKEDRRDDRLHDRDRDRDRVHDRDPERSYVEREGKRNDLYDKEDRKDRYKRPKEDPYAPISQKDTMELNIELQLTIKSIKKELYDNREEMKHMQGLLDEERHENNKLKREISDLKEEVENRKQQIKAERAHRDTLFKENQFVIDKLEAEIKKLRYPPPAPVLPHIPPISLHSSAPFPPRNSLSDIPLQKKQLIASNADRCLWLSTTSLSSQEVYEALGGAGIVENVYVTSRFSAFITFFSTEKAQEAAAQARALFCHQNGVRCNIVNNSIWVGNVHTSEEELREACEYCGEVESIKLMASTHCAFVSFKDTSAAITACSNLDGSFLNSSRLVVNFKYKFTEEGSSSTFFNYPVGKVLYVGDLDATEAELYGLFETFGQIQEVWTPLTGDYAFITFTTVESAVVAKYHLHGRRLGATCLKINYRKGNEDPSFMYSETLAIKTNPPVNSEEQLRSFLAKYAKHNYQIEYKKINHKWIVRMGSGEEGIIVKAHLDSRTVSGVHFDVEYIFTKLKLEKDY